MQFRVSICAFAQPILHLLVYTQVGLSVCRTSKQTSAPSVSWLHCPTVGNRLFIKQTRGMACLTGWLRGECGARRSGPCRPSVRSSPLSRRWGSSAPLLLFVDSFEFGANSVRRPRWWHKRASERPRLSSIPSRFARVGKGKCK